MEDLSDQEKKVLAYVKKKPASLQSIGAYAWCNLTLPTDACLATLRELARKGYVVESFKESRYWDCRILFALAPKEW